MGGRPGAHLVPHGDPPSSVVIAVDVAFGLVDGVAEVGVRVDDERCQQVVAAGEVAVDR
jgi:hypothetical protein